MMYYLMSMGFCFSQAAATVEEVVPFGEAPPAGVELDAAPSSNTELRRFDDLLRRIDDYEFSNRKHARAGCRKYVDRNAVQSRAGRARDHPITLTAEECEARCVEKGNCYLYTWVYVGFHQLTLPLDPFFPIPHDPFNPFPVSIPNEWTYRCVLWSKAKAEKEGRTSPESFVYEKTSTSGLCETEPEQCQSSHCTGDWKLKTGPTYCEGPTCPPNTSVCCNYEGSRLKGVTIEVVKTGNCESNGFEFIKNKEDCKVAGRLVGITSQNSLNNANPGSNRQRYCGTWGGLQYLHFNSQTSGVLQNAGRDRAGERPTYQLCKGKTIVSDIDGDCLTWKGVEEGEGSFETCMPFCEADRDCIGIQTDSDFKLNCELISSSSAPISSCGRGRFTFYPKGHTGGSTEYEYAGCFKSRWDRSKTRDVPTTTAGVQQCRDLCKSAGFKYFGFECPHRGSKGTEVHCECGQTLNEKERIDDAKCREFNTASGKHCTGPFTVEGYSLGAGSLNSAYRV